MSQLNNGTQVPLFTMIVCLRQISSTFGTALSLLPNVFSTDSAIITTVVCKYWGKRLCRLTVFMSIHDILAGYHELTQLILSCISQQKLFWLCSYLYTWTCLTWNSTGGFQAHHANGIHQNLFLWQTAFFWLLQIPENSSHFIDQEHNFKPQMTKIR